MSAQKPPSRFSSAQSSGQPITRFGYGGGRKPQSAASVSSTSSKQTTTRHNFNNAIHTTGASTAVVTKSERESLRFHLCVEAITQGCVQTYIHLYGLLHRAPVCVDELSQTYFAIPEDRMRWVQQMMSTIEVLRRQSEFSEVFAKCRQLADYFEEQRDVEESIWHYEAALRFSAESLDVKLIRDVRGAFAQFYERTHMLHQACDMYGTMVDTAMALKDQEAVKDTCKDLVRAFHSLGDEARSTNPELAKKYYEHSVQYAQRSKSGMQVAEAYSALGAINEEMMNLPKALHYNQEWSAVANQEQMRADECKAELKTASLHERMSANEKAMVSLDRALGLAKNLEDDAKVCQAMMQRGEVHRGEGQSEEAMECFKKSFSAARNSGQQPLIDSSRVAMGFAIGEFYFTHAGNNRGYLPIVCNDVVTQLHWMSTGEL